MSSQTCDSSQLTAIMENDRSLDNYELTLEHLSHCQKCQRELEQIAADHWWWNEGRSLIALSDQAQTTSTSSSVIAICDDKYQADKYQAIDLPEEWSINFLDQAAHPELLGQLGKYQIESVVGRGGMGIVLKGFDTELNRPVAIKVLAPHLASSGSARQRFAREARAAAAVVHDHVVAIYGIDSNGDLPYIVMPLIGGESLQKYVDRNGPLEAIDIVRIAMQIAAGLAAAHEQGLVHRDVKPANILLESGFGRVLITDFGLARAADDASITRSGLVAGTPHYMSPEQANGDSVDQRSDLFSLGSVIYFMATGHAPYRGEGTMAVLNAICHKSARSVREVNASIPQPIDQIIHRLQEKQPNDRFESASSLRSLLADYLAHLQDPIANRLPDALATKSGRRIGWIGWIGVAAATAFATIVACVFTFWPSTIVTTMDQEPRDAEPGQVAGEAFGGRGNPISPYDEDVQNLSDSITQIEEQWSSEAAASTDMDQWETDYQTLKQDIDHLEQERPVLPEN